MSVHTCQSDLASRPFAHGSKELPGLCDLAVELLRCCADAGDPYSEFGPTIEETALELDCTLFVTLLARLWAQSVTAERGEVFENLRVVLLESALRLETSIGTAP